MSTTAVPTDERWRSGPGLLASAWRYRWWVLATVVLTGLLGYVLSSLQPTTYEATARLFLTDPRQVAVFGDQRAIDPERYIPQQGERVTSRPVLERAAEMISVDLSASQIEDRLSVEGDVELDLIEITAWAGEPEVAAEIANTAAAAYTQVARESKLASAEEAASELEAAAQQLDEQIAEIQAAAGEATDVEQVEVLIRQRIDISSRAQQQLVEARVFGSGVDFLEAAEVPGAPASPSPVRDAILAALLGAAAATAVAYWRAGHTTTVEDRNQPGTILGAPLLGVLPVYRSTRGAPLDERLQLDAEAQESYEFLLSSIEYALAGAEAGSILVTSAEPGQGKTEIALQLAVTAVLQGRRTVLIDGDLRVRSLTQLFDADGGPGLVDLAVSAPRQYRSYVQTRRILGGEAQLVLLPAGSTADEGAASLRHAGIRRGLSVIEEETDLVIVDSAPLLATADTTTLSKAVNAMILVVRAGTALRDLESLRERLSFVGCPVLGYVYVTDDPDDVGYAFGYGSYRYRHARTVKSEVVGFDGRSFDDTDVPSWLREPERPSEPVTAPARPPLARRADETHPVEEPWAPDVPASEGAPQEPWEAPTPAEPRPDRVAGDDPSRSGPAPSGPTASEPTASEPTASGPSRPDGRPTDR